MRPRRVVIGLALATFCCLAVAAFYSRDRLLELWWIWRLGSTDLAARSAALEALGEKGSDRGALAIVEELQKEEGPDDSALRVLARIHPRCGANARADILRALLEALRNAAQEEGGISPARSKKVAQPAPGSVEPRSAEPLHDREIVQTLCDLKVEEPQSVDALLSALDRNDTARPVAVHLLLYNWKRAEAAVGRYLSRLEPGEVQRFFEMVQRLCNESTGSSWWRKKPGIWPGTTVQKTANNLVTVIEKPEARAIALSHSIFGVGLDKKPYANANALRVLARNDPSSLVKVAAIRIAGYVGDLEGNVDLSERLFSENDLGLLKEVIEARTLQAFPFAVSPPIISRYSTPGLRLELWDSFLCNWLPRRARSLPWNAQEIERLREILRQETDSNLRDAASHALAIHYRSPGSFPKSSPLPRSLPKLKVHEWGVFRDEGLTSSPAERWLADVPKFVQRSKASTSDLWSSRYYLRTPSLKPVLFFDSPEPVELLIRVAFFQGRPWSFFPDATDYFHGVQQRPWDLPRKEEADLAFPPLQDREGVTPPWILVDPSKVAPHETPYANKLLLAPPGGEWRARYELVPWITPNHSAREAAASELSSFGLEWAGLRVGYSGRLEGEPPAVEPSSWWSHLRNVPSTPVALRGGREGFLFYDGSVRLPSPVDAQWTGNARTALALTFRDLRSYPIPRSRSPATGPHPPTADLPGVFLIMRQPGESVRWRFFENLSTRELPPTVEMASLASGKDELWKSFEAALIRQGLSGEESLALLRTWESEFFEASGFRVLTLLPRWIYDGALPLSIEPPPGEIVRVGIAWKEHESKIAVGISTKDAKEVKAAATTATMSYAWTTETLSLTAEPVARMSPTKFTLDAKSGRIRGINDTVREPVLAGNGLRILLKCQRAGNEQLLCVAELESQELTPVARFEKTEGDVVSLAASDDGQTLAVLLQSEESCRVEVVDVPQQLRSEILITKEPVRWLTLSGDGKKLAFRRDAEIFWVDLESQKAHRLSRRDTSTCQFLSLNADGNLLFFIVVEDNEQRARELHVADASSGSVTSLGQWDGGLCYPSFSADGSHVLLSRRNGLGNPVACLLDRWTGSLISLVEDDAPTLRLPAVTSDGARVFFNRSEELWSVDVATGAQRRCLSSDRYHWSSQPRIDRRGKRVLLFDGSTARVLPVP